MNIENARKALAQLKQLREDQFFMATWVVHPNMHYFPYASQCVADRTKIVPCNTVACGAGWISLLNGGPTENDVGAYVTPFAFARHFLDLHPAPAEYLFYGNWSEKSQENITLAEFIVEFERMIEEQAKIQELNHDINS
jgi:hypothetical protein